MTDTSLVSFDAVGLTASRTIILRDVSLVLEPGDVLGVIGPNGSGKTSLINLLSTMTAPSSGAWTVLGASNTRDRRSLTSIRRQIAMVGHVPALWPELTLRENFDLISALAPGSDMTDALASVGLAGAADRPAALASVGMQRRLEFARILNRLPTLLLLDEAHGGLDRDATTIVDETIARVQARGGAAVLVSHHSAHLDAVATRMARLERGTLIEESP